MHILMQIIFCAKQLEKFKIKREKKFHTQIEIHTSTYNPHIFLDTGRR